VDANLAADQGHRANGAQAAKAGWKIQPAAVVAAGGYCKRADLKTCPEIGMEPPLPAVENPPRHTLAPT
jgi:hypothetical protein